MIDDINITEVAKIFCDAWKQQIARYTNEKAALLKKCGVDFIGDYDEWGYGGWKNA